jgi:hypothetical protein
MQDWRGRRLLLEIVNLQSTFDHSSCGGIAQLVERQLCKLEVRGSNPLASMPSQWPLISDLRFVISDLNSGAPCARRNKIESRQSKFENSAAQPPFRACSSVG